MSEANTFHLKTENIQSHIGTKIGKIRILFLSYYFLPHVGGGGISSYEIALEASANAEMEVVVPNVAWSNSYRGSGTIPKNYPFETTLVGILVPKDVGIVVGPSLVLLKLLATKKPAKYDLILSQYHPHHIMSIVALLIGRIYKRPVVVRADDVHRSLGLGESSARETFYGLITKMVNSVNEYFLRYSNALDLVNSEHLEILRNRRVVLPSHVELSPNGYPQFDDYAGALSETIRNKIGVKASDRILLFVGRYGGKEYGVDIILQGFELLLKECENVVLVLVGDEKGKSVAKNELSPTIASQVRFIGAVGQSMIFDLIRISDVCLGPMGPTCALPLKVMEYMRLGKPVVTGYRSVSRDLARNGENMIVIRPLAEAFRDAILRLLSDQEFAKKIGSQGYADVQAFSWRNVAKRLVEQGIEIHRVETFQLRDKFGLRAPP